MINVDERQLAQGDLVNSAFVILGVSMRANKAQIIDAYDDRLFEGAAEDQLTVARSRLTVLRDRLAEELRFLPDLSPAKAKDAINQLQGVSEAREGSAIADALPNLSRLNAYSTLLGRIKGWALIRGSDRAHREFDPDSAREAIDQTRSASGFPPITDPAWSKGLRDYQIEQASLLSSGLLQFENPSSLLVDIIENNAEQRSAWYDGLINLVVDQYDRWTEPRLSQIEDEIDEAIAECRSGSDRSASLAAVERHLADWDAINQPVQLRDQSKGLDEPKSKRIFGKVRDLAVWLANDLGEYNAAKRLSLSLERTFPELPSVLAQLSEDIETLGSLVENARSRELVQPLTEAVRRGQENLAQLAREILKGRYRVDGGGLAGELFRTFEEARAKADELSPTELPWYLVRSVALDLNNDAGEPYAATRLLENIYRTAPPGIADKIQDDLQSLKILRLQKDLHDAVKSEDLVRARDLAAEIMEAAPDLRAEYARLHAGLNERIASRSRTRWFWGILAAIAAIIMLSEGDFSSSSHEPPSTSSGTSLDDYLTPDATTSEPTISEDPPSNDETGASIPPSEGHFGPLTLPQLRYCMFEKRRLDLLDSRISTSAGIRWFNDRVDDFNSRCAKGSYSLTDQSTINLEMAAKQDEMESEVAELLAKFAPSSTAPVAPTFDGISPESSSDETREGDFGPGELSAVPENELDNRGD